MLDQADVDGEIVAASDEFLGAVQRIDEEERTVHVGHAAGGGLLLRDDRNMRRDLAQAGEDRRLRRVIGGGDGGFVGLNRDGGALNEMPPYDVATRLGQRDQGVHQRRAVQFIRHLDHRSPRLSPSYIGGRRIL